MIVQIWQVARKRYKSLCRPFQYLDLENKQKFHIGTDPDTGSVPKWDFLFAREIIVVNRFITMKTIFGLMMSVILAFVFVLCLVTGPGV
jgi:hypothetical protein